MCLQAFNSFMLLGGASCQSTVFCSAFCTLPAPEMVHVAAGGGKSITGELIKRDTFFSSLLHYLPKLAKVENSLGHSVTLNLLCTVPLVAVPISLLLGALVCPPMKAV